MRGAQSTGSRPSRLEPRAARRGLNGSDRGSAQEVVGGELLETLGHHAQKKSFVAAERDERARATYRAEVKDKATRQLVFVDETSAYVGISREYGWAPSAERVHDTRPKGKKAWVSLIAACSLSGVMAEQALIITDTVNKNAFLAFLETTLLPTLPKGSVLVMDNWTVHHGDDVRNLVDAAGCELLYLPTYSPDLNPIEHLFAKLKAFVKRLRPDSTDALVQAFGDALKTVSPQNILKFVLHCGYKLEP